MKSNAPDKAAPAEFLKVRATQAGYIGDGPLGMIYRAADDVFTLRPRPITVNGQTRILSVEEQFSSRWMEIMPADEPDKLTTAQAAINREIRDLKASGRAPVAEED